MGVRIGVFPKSCSNFHGGLIGRLALALYENSLNLKD